jgi:hypothetical protein
VALAVAPPAGEGEGVAVPPVGVPAREGAAEALRVGGAEVDAAAPIEGEGVPLVVATPPVALGEGVAASPEALRAPLTVPQALPLGVGAAVCAAEAEPHSDAPPVAEGCPLCDAEAPEAVGDCVGGTEELAEAHAQGEGEGEALRAPAVSVGAFEGGAVAVTA